METVPFGIIGCGYRGRELAELCAKHNLPLVAIADEDPAQANRLAQALEVHAQGFWPRDETPEQLLISPDINAVIIATPTDTHFAVVAAAAAAGKHILCEKPLALTPEECEALGDICREYGVRLSVGSQCRLWGVPAFVKTELLPKLGEIHAIVMSRMVNTPEIALLGWRTDIKRNPLGQLMDHHIHNVDLLNWMFGAGKVIAAEMSIGKHVKWDFPDQYHAILAYHSSYGGKRALCSFIASEVSMADEWSLTVDGENGTLKVPAITFLQHVLERNPMTIRYEGGQEERFTPDLPTENPNLTQLRRFLHAIATGGPVDVTAKEAAAAVRIIEDIDRLAVRL